MFLDSKGERAPRSVQNFELSFSKHWMSYASSCLCESSGKGSVPAERAYDRVRPTKKKSWRVSHTLQIMITTYLFLLCFAGIILVLYSSKSSGALRGFLPTSPKYLYPHCSQPWRMLRTSRRNHYRLDQLADAWIRQDHRRQIYQADQPLSYLYWTRHDIFNKVVQ